MVCSGDGKADYVWVSEYGEMGVYLNVIGEDPAKFVPYSDAIFVATGVGGSRHDIRLADIKWVPDPTTLQYLT